MSGTPSDPRRVLEEVRSALDGDELDRAISLIGHALRADPDLREVYDLAARALERQGSHHRQGLLFRLCHDQFDNPRHFYELGFGFMSADLPWMARPLLDRAFRLDPDDPDVRVEFAVALAETGDHARALQTLEGLDPGIRAERPSIVFLGGWCRLLTGDPEGAGRELERLDRLPETHGFDETLRERLSLGIDRLREMGLPGPEDLRGWHFVQYGAALLTTSDLANMGGRFGVVVETYDELAGRLAILATFLRRLDLPVARVATADDVDSEVLGRALAGHLAVERCRWPADGSADALTLLCAGAIEHLGPPADLARRSPELVVYVHKLAWTRSAPCVPDIAGLIAQAHFFPWSRSLTVDAVEHRVIEQPPDRRPPEELAEYLAGRIPDRAPAGIDAMLERYARHRALSVFAGDARVTLRPPFRQESPVAGRRFF